MNRTKIFGLESSIFVVLLVLAFNVLKTQAGTTWLSCGSVTCSEGQSCCNDTCFGPLCYSPSTQTCIQNVRLCASNQQLCGLTCFDPSTQVCFNNRTVCLRSQLPCGKICYDPFTSVCLRGKVANRTVSNVCGTTVCQSNELCCHGIEDRCYNPTNETCCQAQNQKGLRTVCNISSDGRPQKCCASVSRQTVTCFDPTIQFCCNQQRCSCKSKHHHHKQNEPPQCPSTPPPSAPSAPSVPDPPDPAPTPTPIPIPISIPTPPPDPVSPSISPQNSYQPTWSQPTESTSNSNNLPSSSDPPVTHPTVKLATASNFVLDITLTLIVTFVALL
jgi:hypothetical protein